MVEDKLPLGLVRDPSNPLLLGRLKELETFDFSAPRRHASTRLGWDEATALDVELRTKQYMALGFLDMGESHVPEVDADEFWHSMMLHTRWYHAFCQVVFGEYFHHTPGEPGGIDEGRRDRSLAGVHQWFGERAVNLTINCRACQPLFTAKPGLAPRL